MSKSMDVLDAFNTDFSVWMTCIILPLPFVYALNAETFQAFTKLDRSRMPTYMGPYDLLSLSSGMSQASHAIQSSLR